MRQDVGQPGDERRPNGEIRGRRLERRSQEHVAVPRDDPRLSRYARQGVAHGSRLRAQGVPQPYRRAVELRTARHCLVPLRLGQAPWHTQSLQGSVRRTQPDRITRSKQESGEQAGGVHGRNLDAGADSGAIALGERLDGAARERTRCRVHAHRGCVADPDGEVTLIVAAELVGGQFDGAGHPSAQRRLGAHHRLVVTAQQAARQRPPA